MRGRAVLVGKWLVHNWPYLALVVCVFLPMLWMAASLAFRADLFWPIKGVGKPGSDQVEMFKVFIGGGLATAVTLVGALLTREHNARGRRRLQLETVVKSLEFLPAESSQRVPAVLATMVLLGQQRIAIRILGPAWKRGAVDPQTATWLINQVLISDRTDRSQTDADRPDETAMNEASLLLWKHAADLMQSKRLDYSFPGDFQTGWAFPRYRLDGLRGAKKRHSVKKNILMAMGTMLISRDRDWWCHGGNPPVWPTDVLLECTERDTDPSARSFAAMLFGAVYDCFPDQVTGFFFEDNRVEKALEKRKRAEKNTALPRDYFKLADGIREKWGTTTSLDPPGMY